MFVSEGAHSLLLFDANKWSGSHFIAAWPVVAGFLAEHAEINVELLLLDRVVDLVEEGIDLAVRVAKLPDSSMVAQAVGEVRRVVVASPAFIDSGGPPANPADLRGRAFSRHRCSSREVLVVRVHRRTAAGRRTRETRNRANGQAPHRARGGAQTIG